MRAAFLAAALTTLVASPLAARDIVLSPPLACDLGTDCFIQQYVDHDPKEGASDYRCSTLSYDNHKGTDFALRSLDQMRRGVDVLAAAPGTVRATRDGMPDQLLTAENSSEIDGRDCGNGLVVEHDDGWTTQYCHLKNGSVAVLQGDRVTRQTVLGQVGLSGRTQFPHVHLTLRQGDTVVDPFAPDGNISCDGSAQKTLWQDDLPYRPGAVLAVGFSDKVPDFSAIKGGTAARPVLSVTAPAIVVYGYAFGGKQGDQLRLTIDGPTGTFMDETVTLDRDQAQFFRAVGKKRRTPAWPEGTYLGTVTLIRDDVTLNTENAELSVE